MFLSHEMAKFPYDNVVGCMMYAVVLTRPNISHALSIVSRYMATPGKEHCQAVKWILRYWMVLRNLDCCMEGQKGEVVVCEVM